MKRAREREREGRERKRGSSCFRETDGRRWAQVEWRRRRLMASGVGVAGVARGSTPGGGGGGWLPGSAIASDGVRNNSRRSVIGQQRRAPFISIGQVQRSGGWLPTHSRRRSINKTRQVSRYRKIGGEDFRQNKTKKSPASPWPDWRFRQRGGRLFVFFSFFFVVFHPPLSYESVTTANTLVQQDRTGRP